MALIPGQALGTYRIEAQLGQGGMATIYRAAHTRLSRTVAIKVMHPTFNADRNFAARFEREAQIVARLEHPHIVPIYDFSDVDGQPYIVMKFIDGRTLKAWLESDQPPTLSEIVRTLTPLADALDYAHISGVLHRDIKPSNIIIDRAGTPYLMDFGLARMAQLGDSTLSTDMLLGTPHYISPEQAQGKRDLNAQTDIYSFGVVLYELLTGRVPFSADTPFAIIHDHIYRPLPAPSSVNPAITPDVEAVLVRALAKDPAERYESASAMIAAFAAAAERSGMGALDPDRVRHGRAADESAALRQTQTPIVPAMPAIPAGGTGESDTISLHPAPAPAETPMPIRAAAPPPGTPSGAAEHPPGGNAVRAAAAVRAIGGMVADRLERAGAAGPAERDREQADRARWKRPASTDDGYVADDEGKPKRRVVEEPRWESARETGRSLREAGEAVGEALEEIFNPEDEHYAPEDDERAIRKRVEKQLEAKREFFGHASMFVIINIILWAIFASTNSEVIISQGMNLELRAAAEFPWPVIVMLGWGSGLIGHGVSTFYKTGDRARRRFSAVRAAYRRQFGANWWTAPRSELKRIRKQAEKPFEQREEFFSHLGIFFAINIMLWVIFLSSSLGGVLLAMDEAEAAAIVTDFPWPLVVTLLWGIGLVSHAVQTFGRPKADRHLEAEIARERAWIQDESMAYSKPKNDAYAANDPFAHEVPPRMAPRLNSEGELTNSFVEEMRTSDGREKRQR